MSCYVKKEFGNPVSDEWAKGTFGKHAIKGREQQKIDSYGGVGDPKVGNSIRGVAKGNKAGLYYHWMSNLYFGNLHGYTGSYFP